MLQIDAPPVENFWLRHWPRVYSNNVSISHSFSDTTTFTAYATVNLRSLKDCLPKLNSVLTHSWPAAIDRCLLSTGRSAVNPPGAVAAVDRRDRQTDGRTTDLYVDPAARPERDRDGRSPLVLGLSGIQIPGYPTGIETGTRVPGYPFPAVCSTTAVDVKKTL